MSTGKCEEEGLHEVAAGTVISARTPRLGRKEDPGRSQEARRIFLSKVGHMEKGEKLYFLLQETPLGDACGLRLIH